MSSVTYRTPIELLNILNCNMMFRGKSFLAPSLALSSIVYRVKEWEFAFVYVQSYMAELLKNDTI